MGWAMGFLGFDSRWGLGNFLFTTASRTALGPTQPPIQWVPEALFLGVERPGSEADHSPPSSADVKECVELYLYFPNTPSWRGARLKKSTGTNLHLHNNNNNNNNNNHFLKYSSHNYFILNVIHIFSVHRYLCSLSFSNDSS
jgi:hypothetical protein